jgi:hypothetical protein
MPIFQWELAWLASELHIISFDAVNVAGALRAKLQVIPNGPLVVGGQVLYQDSALWPMVISTPLAQAYQSPLILYSAALSWPSNSIRGRVLLLVIASPLALILTMLDVPLILLGSIWSNLFDNFAPGTNSLIAALSGWISDGGRLAMCIVAVTLTIGLSQLLTAADFRFR